MCQIPLGDNKCPQKRRPVLGILQLVKLDRLRISSAAMASSKPETSAEIKPLSSLLLLYICSNGAREYLLVMPHHHHERMGQQRVTSGLLISTVDKAVQQDCPPVGVRGREG